MTHARWKGPLWAGSAVLLVMAALWVLSQRLPGAGGEAGPGASGRYLTQAVDRGDVERRVQATGTLNPVSRVTVGSQASGTIRRVLVDFNEPVRRGQLLAEIDPEAAAAQAQQARAQIDSARASLELAQLSAQRSRLLWRMGYLSQSEVDEATQAERSAKAVLDQQLAVLRKEQANVANTRIVSPIDGVVVSRDVNPGQTVAASFQTPSLFTIAQNLTHMQIDTSVAEADIGLVQPGQPVSFTVDAFPSQSFHGVVHQIRNNYSVVQNVVTYNVVIRADNPQALLRPGMTAYVGIAVQRADGATRVPNAALRWAPPARPAGTTPVVAAASSAVGAPALALASVYRLRGDRIERVEFVPGVANGTYTQALAPSGLLEAGALQLGDLLVVGERGQTHAPVPPGMRMF